MGTHSPDQRANNLARAQGRVLLHRPDTRALSTLHQLDAAEALPSVFPGTTLKFKHHAVLVLALSSGRPFSRTVCRFRTMQASTSSSSATSTSTSTSASSKALLRSTYEYAHHFRTSRSWNKRAVLARDYEAANGTYRIRCRPQNSAREHQPAAVIVVC